MALLATYTFLAVNRWRLEADELAAADTIESLAAGTLTEPMLALWITEHVENRSARDVADGAGMLRPCRRTPRHSAREFVDRLASLRPADHEGAEPYAGIGMGQIFKLAREFQAVSPSEIEQLLESEHHPVRVGAVSIMDWQARDKKTPMERRRELFDLYLHRHDRIDTWDLVDRSAIYVVGEYLVDKPRDVLYELARSAKPMEQRTAILSTFAFIRRGELDDTYRIAETLASDPDPLVGKAVGWMLREAGKRDHARLASFLDAHAGTMPREMLRYSIEKLDRAERDRYLAMKRR